MAAELSLEQANVKRQENGEYHAADLLSHKIKMHMQAENRKSLTYAQAEDSKKDLLYKHYKTIQSYQHAFDEFSSKVLTYRSEEEFATSHSIRNYELAKI